MRRKTLSFRNPGLFLGVLIFAVWLLCWVLFMGPLGHIVIAGLPLLTWSQIVLGIVAILISAASIIPLDKWERS
jgi:hypothetical protein